MSDNLLFDDLYIDTRARDLAERNRCIDEVYKRPGIDAGIVARGAGLDREVAYRHLKDACDSGEVRREKDRWYPCG